LVVANSETPAVVSKCDEFWALHPNTLLACNVVSTKVDHKVPVELQKLHRCRRDGRRTAVNQRQPYLLLGEESNVVTSESCVERLIECLEKAIEPIELLGNIVRSSWEEPFVSERNKCKNQNSLKLRAIKGR